MRTSLRTWIADAETLKYVDRLRIPVAPTSTGYLLQREDDYFVALVGELFDRLREGGGPADDLALLGNAFGEFGLGRASTDGTSLPSDTALFAAMAYYLGGFSASATLMLSAADQTTATDGHRAANEILRRPLHVTSEHVAGVLEAVRTGDMAAIDAAVETAARLAGDGRRNGPEEWVGWRLYQRALQRFRETNLRRVLPDGATREWDVLIESLISRSPPVWEFFPSQIAALESGLVSSNASYALQMPTGAGKTTLIETVLFSHLTRSQSGVAIVLVPFRALAAELKGTLVRRLNEMGINARALYGGTVPTGDEVHALEDLRALVATPESLSGLLSANAFFQQAIDLVVCDEGHLLDSGARGVALELLLARLRARRSGSPRFVFISAIVPNIDEVNAWLGGTEETVVRSDFRPALAEFARLDVEGSGAKQVVDLTFHPHRDDGSSVVLSGFLAQNDFRYFNEATNRWRTYSYSSIKTRTVAAARKALHMGTVAVFAANKRGDQGCVGLARELLTQLEAAVPLPKPADFLGHAQPVNDAVDYLRREYGASWIATSALEAGAVVHHGDIPQESREVLEHLVRQKSVPLAFCTSTLAEGVNLPIRTIVLYSIRRRSMEGSVDLLARDIKNLVGRAGRAGASTHGLVICANADQWPIMAPVALQAPEEPVHGALLALLNRLYDALLKLRVPLTNDALESTLDLHPLIDGVDLTLMDLAAEEIPEEELLRLAGELTSQTYAAQQVQPPAENALRTVIQLRAERILEVRRQGRLPWIRETGARVRMLDLVEADLLPRQDDWTDFASPTDDALLEVIIGWARTLPTVERALAEVDRDEKLAGPQLLGFVRRWLRGQPVREVADATGLEIDDALAVLSRVVAYELQTAVEQGVVLLGRLCEARGQQIADSVVRFPDHLRLGVPTSISLVLAGTIRHRRAAVALGESAELSSLDPEHRETVLRSARALLDDTGRWLPLIGPLVLRRTKQDLQRYASQEENLD